MVCCAELFSLVKFPMLDMPGWGFFKLLLNLLFRVLCSAFSSISPLHVDCYVPLSPYLMYTGFNFLVFLIFIGP